jgi:hypothetical protein
MSIFKILVITLQYELALVQYIFFGRTYKNSNFFDNDKWAKVQIFSLSLVFKMWNKPHYRSRSYQQDMIDNLKNVAIPGTGIPLSVFCYNWWVCLWFVLIINPIVCLLGAINKSRKLKINGTKFIYNVCNDYIDHLLHPQDWFSFW